MKNSCGVLAAWLICGASLASAQHRAAADSDLDRGVGHWVASGVSFQSGTSAHHFTVEVTSVGDQLQATLPAELKLAGGRVYLLARAAGGVFRHADDEGRVVQFSLTGPNRASLLVTGRGGDGRVTWQLTR
jgi:hypothetical protein